MRTHLWLAGAGLLFLVVGFAVIAAAIVKILLLAAAVLLLVGSAGSYRAGRM
jgi:hypothetical protein